MAVALHEDESAKQQSNSVYAALARTGSRSLAIYFSRPIRLFKPAKLSGWQTLQAHALQSGSSLTPQYILSLAKNQFSVLPRHFIPPIFVNATLGMVLWTTYTEAAYHLTAHLGPHPTTTAALAGAMAGAAQACAAAPVENVRLIIEGNSSKAGWSHAWKELFLRSELTSSTTKQENIQKARELRVWMKDVRDMAGRGWEGWGWGLAKDSCGFAVFFAIFEITRRAAIQARSTSEYLASNLYSDRKEVMSLKQHAPRAIHGVTLVAGGVAAGIAYEFCTRPWDSARRAVYVDRVTAAAASPPRKPSAVGALVHKARDEGVLSFLRDPSTSPTDKSRSAPDRFRRRLIAMSRMLARVGPWGLGFLVWESLGPGIS